MTDIDNSQEAAMLPAGVGQQLRAARESAGMTIAQLAAESRISQRNLENIEAGNFAALPGRTYAVGFAKTYAKMVGLDQADIAAMVNQELAAQDNAPRSRQQTFEPGDPARIPSASLGWLSAIALVLLLVGLFFAARLLFSPAAEMPSLITQAEAERTASAQVAGAATRADQKAQPAAVSGPVVFTALENVWVKFYDAQGKQLLQKELVKGESYTVPADAADPQLLTGRPDALAIAIGGKPVPKLSDTVVTMNNVPVSAAALLARPAPAPAPAPAATPSPTN